jgi:hypothetical protein
LTQGVLQTDTKVAYCSCTDEPSWADECMRKFEVGGGITLESAVDIKEIFKSQKTTHFKNIHKKTGIAFEDMIFYGAVLVANYVAGTVAGTIAGTVAAMRALM